MKAGDIFPFGLGFQDTFHRENIPITEKFLRRWECMFETYGFENPGKGLRIGALEEFTTLRGYHSNPFIMGPRNLDIDIGLDDSGRYLRVMITIFMNVYVLSVIVLLSLAYGGIHMSAWNWNFPTHVERTLWRASCIYIMFAVPVMYMTFRCTLALEDVAVKRWDLRFMPRVIYLLGTLFWASFVAARVFIIVEAFLSLRQVSVGVYLSPSWLQMFPHV